MVRLFWSIDDTERWIKFLSRDLLYVLARCARKLKPLCMVYVHVRVSVSIWRGSAALISLSLSLSLLSALCSVSALSLPPPQMSNQEHHELYELLMSYLKAMQALSNSQKHIESLRGQYHTHQVLLWHAEPREITCTVSTNNHKHKPSTCIARNFCLEKIFISFAP